MPKRQNKVKIILNKSTQPATEVINALIDICGHNLYQATQCVTIVDLNGSYEIYDTFEDEAAEVMELLKECGLNITFKVNKK